MPGLRLKKKRSMGVNLRLKFAILEVSPSQRQFAAENDFAENRLSDIVRGWVEPTDDEARRLSRATRKPVAELLGERQQVA
jgi:hypothetical protein